MFPTVAFFFTLAPPNHPASNTMPHDASLLSHRTKNDVKLIKFVEPASSGVASKFLPVYSAETESVEKREGPYW